MPPILYLFTLTNLVIGTGAFVLTGILQPMAAGLGVSVAAAGQAMTAYALSSALIAPIVLLGTGRWPRRKAMLLALALFTVGCAISAAASTLAMLLVGRILMGAGSVFGALAAGVAVSIVKPSLRGRALSVTFMGMGLSYAIGIPLGTLLGFRYGWHTPLWMVTAVCLAMTVALAALLPRHIESPGASFAGLRDAVRSPAILRVWLRTLLTFVAIFCVFSYVGPVLTALNPLTPGELALTLVLFGLSGVAGTLSGGWAGDRFGAVRTLRVQLSIFLAMLAAVPLTAGHPVLTVLAFMAWGIAGFGMMSPQQVLLASRWPAQAPLLMSLNGSMLNVGMALGAAVGGALAGALGFERISWAGLPFALLAFATIWFESAGPRPKAATA